MKKFINKTNDMSLFASPQVSQVQDTFNIQNNMQVVSKQVQEEVDSVEDSVKDLVVTKTSSEAISNENNNKIIQVH